jgi:hypothetical protein
MFDHKSGCISVICVRNAFVFQFANSRYPLTAKLMYNVDFVKVLAWCLSGGTEEN